MAGDNSSSEQNGARAAGVGSCGCGNAGGASGCDTQVSGEENVDPFTARGVASPRVIDLIKPDATTSQVTLYMFEPRPWGDARQQIEDIQEKFNNYLDFVLDGYFVGQFPGYTGWQVVLHFVSATEPPSVIEQLLTDIASYSSTVGLSFARSVDPAIATALPSS